MSLCRTQVLPLPRMTNRTTAYFLGQRGVEAPRESYQDSLAEWLIWMCLEVQGRRSLLAAWSLTEPPAKAAEPCAQWRKAYHAAVEVFVASTWVRVWEVMAQVVGVVSQRAPTSMSCCVPQKQLFKAGDGDQLHRLQMPERRSLWTCLQWLSHIGNPT